MKTRLYSIIVILNLLIGSANGQPNANKELYDTINDHWRAREYVELLAIIQSREQADADDILALSMTTYYYIFIEGDPAKARAAAEKLEQLLSLHENLVIRELVHELTKDILSEEAGEPRQITQEQRDTTHAIFTDYPFIDQIFVLWGIATEQVE